MLTLSWAEVPSAKPLRVQSESRFASVYRFPAGTEFLVIAESYARTDMNQMHDPVEGRLGRSVYAGEQKILDRSTKVLGYLSRLEPPIQGRDAIMAVQIRAFQLPDGRQFPVEAFVKTDEEANIWGGGLTPGTVPKKVQHRVFGIGYYNKLVMGGPRAMGSHFEIVPGELWNVVLTAPLDLPVTKPFSD